MPLHRKVKEEIKVSFLFLFPTLLLIIIVAVYPLIYSFFLSFTQWNLISMPSPIFVGLNNYQYIFVDSLFKLSVIKTVYFLAVTIPTTILLSFSFALILNYKKFKGRSVYLGLLIIPWAMAPVVNAVQWRWIFNAKFGIFNYILYKLGIIKEYLLIFDDPTMSLLAVSTAEIWKAIPFITLLFLAGLSGIDPSLYEAAMVDGAGLINRFNYITLPLMKRVLMMATTLQIIWSIQAFDTIYVMTKGGPANQTMFINYYVWRVAFEQLNLGYASTLAYIVLFISLIVAIVYIKLVQV
uniref:Sugar ABC transporter permease n=1 Tax=candidate division CPR3 bacterium TaxID=2268181 RepID=A0A7C5Z3L2_UNCC3